MEMSEKEIRTAISNTLNYLIGSRETIELTGSRTGYPEPYLGIGVKVEPEEFIETRAACLQLQYFVKQLNEMLDEDEKQLSEPEFCTVHTRPGWHYGVPTSVHVYDGLICKRSAIYTTYVIKEGRDLARFIQDANPACVEYALRDEENGFLNGLLEEHGLDGGSYLELLDDPNAIDDLYNLVISKPYYIAEPPVEDETFDYVNDLMLATFDTQEELDSFLEETIFDLDYNNLYVWLRGYTYDLADKLNAGGGIVTGEQAATPTLKPL